MRGRPRLGQHFLVSDPVISELVSWINPRRSDVFVEVGPGKGALTLPLLAAGATVRAVEKDAALAGGLPKLATGLPGDLHVTCGDATQNLPVPKGARWRLVGNIPYSISSPLLGRLASGCDGIIDAHLMMQKEFADRVAAGTGSRDYGRISVLVQTHYDAQVLFGVDPSAFNPPPKVESAVVRLVPNNRAAALANRGLFDDIVRAAFAQRRKKLANALGVRYASACGELGAMRAEQLSVTDYIGIANEMAKGEGT